MRNLLCACVFALLFLLLASFPAAQEVGPFLFPEDGAEIPAVVSADGTDSGEPDQAGPEGRIGLNQWRNGVVVSHQGGMAVLLPGGAIAPAQLYGQLGSNYSGLFDAVVTRDGSTALVSNYNDATVYFVDISDPFHLAVKGCVHLPFYAEDIALSGNSKWALVTDGGSSADIAVIDVERIALRSTLRVPCRSLNSVTFSPDDRTVLATDYFGPSVELLSFDPVRGALRHMQSISTLRSGFRPVNAAISPGGTTAVVVGVALTYLGDTNYRGETGAVFQLSGGQLIAQRKITINSHFRIAQTVVFSPDGRLVYIYGNLLDPEFFLLPTKGEIVKIPLTAPGTLGPVAAANIVEIGCVASGFFGVETMALDNSGRYLYVSNKSTPGANRDLFILGPDVLQVLRTPTAFPDYNDPDYPEDVDFPTGVAFPARFALLPSF